jgi:predicted RNA-binding protein YlqC (UPF0109 family)
LSDDQVDEVESDVDDSDVDDNDEVDPNRVPAATAQAVLEYVVRSIVDDPDSVEIDLDEDGRRPALNVHVAPGDMGRVIGKRGRVAQSIRTVVRAAASRDGVEVEVEFVD